MKSKFIDAKELQGVVELNPRHIIRSSTQRRLGIAEARDKTCQCPIRWRRHAAAEGLRRKGYAVTFDQDDD